jgi:hypothetical protein
MAESDLLDITSHESNGVLSDLQWLIMRGNSSSFTVVFSRDFRKERWDFAPQYQKRTFPLPGTLVA